MAKNLREEHYKVLQVIYEFETLDRGQLVREILNTSKYGQVKGVTHYIKELIDFGYVDKSQEADPRKNQQEGYQINEAGKRLYRKYLDTEQNAHEESYINSYEVALLNDCLPKFSKYYHFDIWSILDSEIPKKVYPPNVIRNNIIISYLVHEGYISGVEFPPGHYQLSDLGRKLRESGAIHSLQQLQVDEREIERKRQVWRDRKAHWDSRGGIWITVILCLLAVCTFLGIKTCGIRNEGQPIKVDTTKNSQ